MANYFTYFSFVVKLKTADQKQYALDLANKKASHRFSDEPVPDGFPVDLVDVLEDWAFEAEEEKDGIWLHSENGGVDAVCAFVQYLLQQFDQEGRVEFEWSTLTRTMKTIIVRRLDLQFDAGQATHGPASAQADRALELINLTLQREPFGLGAQLFAHRDEIEVETQETSTD